MSVDVLAHLETFVAAADAGGVTRAAEALELPQPLVSRRIQSLERAWGTQLFDRASHGLTLTALGDLALPYARDVVQRARHLDETIAAARAGVVHLIGVPPGCPPRALAQMIGVAAGRGSTIALHEASAAARRDGLALGHFAAALVRTAPSGEATRVVTGLARRPESGGPAGRPVHLDSLRPRRGARDGGATSTLLLTPEDDVEPFAGGLRRAAARAGISETSIRGVASAVAGAAEVLAAGAALICDARTAADVGLDWAPLADETLHRGYELAAAGTGAALDRDVLAELRQHAAVALGAAATEQMRPGDAPESSTRGDGERLAARGL